MAQLAKFHTKAIALFGCQQIAEGVPVNNASPTGTITTTAGSAAVTGVGTAFTTEVALWSYLYNTAGTAIIGQVIAIASNTALTLDAVVPASPIAQSAGVQAVSGAVTTAAFKVGLGPKNAIAALNMNFDAEYASEAYQYTGDELSRDEITNITDVSAKFDFETMLPTRGTMAGSASVESEIPLADWYQATGMALVLETGGYSITNSVASDAYMTIEVRRSSPSLNNEQKTYICNDARGSIDFDGMLGSKPKLKFNMIGNLGSIVQKMTLVPNFRNMKIDVTPALKSSTVILSALDVYTTASVPATSGSSNFAFQKFTSPNMSGFTYDRYLLSDVDGWSKGATPTDVTLTIVEDSAAATLDPYAKVESDFLFTVKYADSKTAPTTGKKIDIVLNKVKLTKVGKSTVAAFAGLDLGFRGVGTTTIKFY
jgi:hypothetical protein